MVSQQALTVTVAENHDLGVDPADTTVAGIARSCAAGLDTEIHGRWYH